MGTRMQLGRISQDDLSSLISEFNSLSIQANSSEDEDFQAWQFVSEKVARFVYGGYDRERKDITSCMDFQKQFRVLHRIYSGEHYPEGHGPGALLLKGGSSDLPWNAFYAEEPYIGYRAWTRDEVQAFYDHMVSVHVTSVISENIEELYSMLIPRNEQFSDHPVKRVVDYAAWWVWMCAWLMQIVSEAVERGERILIAIG